MEVECILLASYKGGFMVVSSIANSVNWAYEKCQQVQRKYQQLPLHYSLTMSAVGFKVKVYVMSLMISAHLASPSHPCFEQKMLGCAIISAAPYILNAFSNMFLVGCIFYSVMHFCTNRTPVVLEARPVEARVHND